MAQLSSGQTAAIKKLDTSSSPEPDSDFAAQVNISTEPALIFTRQAENLYDHLKCTFHSFVCSYQQFQDLNMSTLLGYSAIASKEIIEYWHMSMQQWVLYMMFYMVGHELLLNF